jgi:hypothetical protein
VASLARLDPRFRPYVEALLAVARGWGVAATVTSTYRSLEDQKRLHQRYQAGLSRFPAAAPGSSAHNYGLAADLVTRPDVNAWLGQIWRAWGFPYYSNDAVHFGVW